MRKREYHGCTKTLNYGRWSDMRDRCRNPKHPAYQNYGGRGITVCDEWENSFTAFQDDMGTAPFKGAQLDRTDNDGPYCKSNCRWITKKEQAQNTRRNVYYTMDGVSKIRSQWAEEYGVNPYTFRDRIRRGWSMKDALTRKPMATGWNVREHYS